MNRRKSKNNLFYFFIGTEAEFIKLLPILLRFEQHDLPYKIIASGQNNIEESTLFMFLKKNKSDILLSQEKITQNAMGLLFWFIKTFIRGYAILGRELSDKRNEHIYLFVHGDTVSTVLGAVLGKLYRIKVAHIEAGLRSFDYLNPFPEELDRTIVSRLTDIHFCPNAWAMNNVQSRKGKKVNTLQNTLIETLALALKQQRNIPLLDELGKKKYFVFVMHRQENLMNEKLVEYLINDFLIHIKDIECIFIQHTITRLTLERLNLTNKIKKNRHIHITPRVGYIEFMHILKQSEFIITDGGSNQEECSYLGKPTLLLRKVTERIEGLGKNVVLSKNNIDIVKDFVHNYPLYKGKKNSLESAPSKIIVDYFIN